MNAFVLDCAKIVRELNWIAEPELSLLLNVNFIIFIYVVFPPSVLNKNVNSEGQWILSFYKIVSYFINQSISFPV